jgi:DNA repair exonuclease SbcCD nuclease subunit
MSYLFIGDPHIKSDNGEAIDILLLELERICSTKRYDAIIIGGDVMHYHERLFTPALNKALTFIDRLRKIAFTYVLVGNHDAINNSIFLTDAHWMNALKSWANVKIVDNVVEEEDILLCPYVPPSRLVEAFETACVDWREKKVIFVHQEIKGCKMGAIVSTDGDEWESDWPVLISGHIHDHQRIGENVYYPGTPLQHAFGDSDTRVVCDISINDINDNKRTPIITFVPLNVPTKRIVKASIDSIKNAISNKKESETIKIKLDATPEEFGAFKKTAEYSNMIEKGIKIQLSKSDTTLKREDSSSSSLNFKVLLEKFIEDDESDTVKSLYDELILEKLVISDISDIVDSS